MGDEEAAVEGKEQCQTKMDWLLHWRVREVEYAKVKLSPTEIRILDFSCRMMAAGSKALELLQQHCSREEMVSVARTACEDMVMDMLKAAKKNEQIGALTVSPEHGTHLKKML